MLFDSASSRSYIDPYICQQLGLKLECVSDVEYEVRTFLGSGHKTLGETTLEVHLPSGRYIALPILIDKTINSKLEDRGLKESIQKF